MIVPLLALILAFLPMQASAHNIPNDVTIQTFLKPEGEVLHLLVRVPMKALRDIEFPNSNRGFLDISRVDPLLRDAAVLWISNSIDLYENDTLLSNPAVIGVRVSLPSDKSFETYPEAIEHLNSPRLPDNTDLVWDQGLADILFDYKIHSDRSEFSIRPAFARLGLRVLTALRFLPPSGVIRAFEFPGDPGLVRLDPRWHQAALRFVELGVVHILGGTDHLLFLLCLVIPFRKFRSLVLIVTSFTAAHSVALFASAYGLAPGALWFPPLVETLIATSILYMAIENIVGTSVQRRWMITFAFGLVHGFGFSFVLRETFQFAGTHLLTSLVSFNLGVELGQVLVLGLLIPALGILFRIVAERTGTIILSAIVAHTAWHWMVDRAEVLRQYQFQPLTFDAAFLASVLRGLMVIVAFAAAGWAISRIPGFRKPGNKKDITF